MRNFVSLLVLYLVTATAFAGGTGTGGGIIDDSTAPEPEVLSLLGIAALAFLVARRIKK
jgi:hypothetical protein